MARKKPTTAKRKEPKHGIRPRVQDNGPILPPIIHESAEHPEDMARIMRGAIEQANKALDLLANLERVETFLRGVLEEYLPTIESLAPLRLSDKETREIRDPLHSCAYSVPENAPREHLDARQAFTYLILLKANRTAKPTPTNRDKAIINAIWLATYLERMKYRPFEPAVVTGTKVRKGESKGGRATAGTPEKRKADEARWQKRIVEIRGPNRRISRTEACNQLAEAEWAEEKSRAAAAGKKWKKKCPKGATIYQRVGKNLPK